MSESYVVRSPLPMCGTPPSCVPGGSFCGILPKIDSHTHTYELEARIRTGGPILCKNLPLFICFLIIEGHSRLGYGSVKPAQTRVLGGRFFQCVLF